MDNPIAIRFINEQMRVRCESLRALSATIKADLVDWHSKARANVEGSPSKSPIDDKRDAEGVSRLDKDDVLAVIGVLMSLDTLFSSPGVQDIIAKPCVRTLEVR